MIHYADRVVKKKSLKNRDESKQSCWKYGFQAQQEKLLFENENRIAKKVRGAQPHVFSQF